ncbi:hypothetical protein SAMN04488020_101396 [Palleronia marisminoris]|uniref:Uncharacterized protein n=1 Tax=Palleronia marisminoris TaxID=315423 RepID=A0A1Y5RFX7_9RHOB|nr:hypothetical protein [Palleronia marisminoris]SFG17256.1 hypothetical protein SAMN04488020_101396 [Palleronia marisminoris]SLN16571.1 hypothetical protein PAM7066_00396 [Palleronia marisminoris]
MKLTRLAGLAALGFLAVGQARAEPASHEDGLGFGIIRDLTPVLRPVVLTPKPSEDNSPKIERIQIVRNDAARME